jgi:hypothetical protein
MKDREWCKRIEDEISGLRDRIKKLEGDDGRFGPNKKIIELEIEWPEADIEGLHFNAQRTRGIFDLKEDGNYYSRDILFHSARDTDDGTGRDLLSEYLDSEAVEEAFLAAINNTAQMDIIHVFLPEENQGIKKYNGVSWNYWLQSRYTRTGSTTVFCGVNTSGAAYSSYSNYVYGVAPAFCVGNTRMKL